MGINVQPSHEGSPWEKGSVETSFSAVGTLLAQYVAGYVGSSVKRRGKNAEQAAVWSMLELQELLDEWLVTTWQARPHDGLRHPLMPGNALTPNEMYAALVETAGYVAVPLSDDDYIELLPATGRAINAYGVKIRHRTYDGKALNPYRRQHSGVNAHKGLWEVHADPYDVPRIWVRNHLEGGWIQVLWTHLRTGPAPFGEQAWDHARQMLTRRGQDAVTETETETEIADAAHALLDKAERGPERVKPTKKDQRVTGRARAVSAAERSLPRPSPQPAPPWDGDDDEDSEQLAQVIQESRYRRLLALYPREYRREYAEEMLAVLMADGRSDPGQTFDLVKSALGAHWRQSLIELRGESWRRAARAVQIFGALLLLGVAARRAAMSVSAFLAYPELQPFVIAPADLARLAAWAVAAAAGLLGLRSRGVRSMAVVAAAAGLAGEIAAPARYYLDTPARVLNAYWIILAAAVVLTASFMSERVAFRTAAPRGSVLMGAACLAVIASGTPLAGAGGLGAIREIGYFDSLRLVDNLSPGPLLLLLIAAVLAVAGVARQQAATRRRIVACAVPVVAAFPLVKVGFAGLIAYNMGHPESTVLLDPVRWTVLVAVPLAAFAVAVELNRRLEETRFQAARFQAAKSRTSKNP
jgi:hypothetical protein